LVGGIQKGIKMGVNYGLDKVRFVSPVKVGSRIRLRGVLKNVEDIAAPVGTSTKQKSTPPTPTAAAISGVANTVEVYSC
jgi:acyl dehydratase